MDALVRGIVIGVVGLAVVVFCLWLLWKPPSA